MQDEDGFVWIATSSGLNRFDGKDFVKYYSTGSVNQLPSNTITKLVCLSHQRLAVGTSEGLAILNTKSGEIRQLILPAPDELKVTTNSIQDITKDTAGNLVVATGGGVYVFNTTLKLIFRYDAYVPEDIGKKRLLFTAGNSLHLLPKGRVLVWGEWGFMLVLDIENKTLKNISDIPGNEFDFLKPYNGVGSYSLGSNNNGVFFLIPNYVNHFLLPTRLTDRDSIVVIDIARQMSVVSVVPFLSSNWTERIITINDTLLCISATNPKGVYFAHFNTHTLSVTSVNKILPDISCPAIITDNGMRTWICSNNGIFKQSPKKAAFNNIFPPPISSGNNLELGITGIIHYQHKYFINLYLRGVLLYDENMHFIKHISFNKAGKANYPWDISYYSEDTLLIGTGIGSLLFNTVNNTLKKFWQMPMPGVIDSNALVCSFIDSRRKLWMGIGTGNGLFTMDLTTRAWQYFSPKTAGSVFKLRYPVSIAEAINGDIWMAGNEGFTRWSLQKQRFDTLITKLPVVGAIAGSWNNFTMDKKDNIWVIEKGPVLVKWNITNHVFKYYPLPASPPLTANLVRGPWNSRVWIQTNKGLLSFNIIKEQFTLIKKSDGLYDDDISALYFDTSTKRMFVGFNNAFTWFHPEDVLKERKPVSPLIINIKKIGDSLSYARDTVLSFSYKENSFSIGFTGIDYDDGENNTYAYQLFEKKPGPFIPIGQQKTVTFANLTPGRYTFQVKTILPDGTESAAPTSLEINIAFPFYERWWFYLLVTCFIMAILYALYRYRIDQLLKVQKIRNSIAGDLHDDIGSTLSSISIMSELAKDKSPEAAGLLDAIGENAATIQENMSDIVWAINPKNDRFENVLQRMNQFAAEILEAKNIELDFKSNEVLAASKLPMARRKNLYLFFKEAINNAAKHSGANKVTVMIMQQNNHITMDISDDGDGFDPDITTGGNGMNTLEKRAVEMGGSFSINSTISKGTTIHLAIKIT